MKPTPPRSTVVGPAVVPNTISWAPSLVPPPTTVKVSLNGELMPAIPVADAIAAADGCGGIGGCW
eukprot:CAMPEP_0184422522 /NCGR_PEP_ID=MMETSP0738-20130409/78417_1 /TAXON_ID=385413 /ORGANISM="Thalassiosira miniscula, Strain CCMP1093" /LENGTH=64 /DNA_ID=CAMNT_0026784267 /DNA_START=178 /DNA_END=372 /DNA_ORIENTATION=+